MAMSRAERRRAEKLAKKKQVGKTDGPPNLQLILQDAVKDRQAGRLEQALAGFKLILKHEPNRNVARVVAATVAFDLQRYKEAASLYGAAVKQEPENARAQFGLALAHKTLGAFDKAEAAARVAVTLSQGAAEPVSYTHLTLPTICSV